MVCAKIYSGRDDRRCPFGSGTRKDHGARRRISKSSPRPPHFAMRRRRAQDLRQRLHGTHEPGTLLRRAPLDRAPGIIRRAPALSTVTSIRKKGCAKTGLALDACPALLEVLSVRRYLSPRLRPPAGRRFEKCVSESASPLFLYGGAKDDGCTQPAHSLYAMINERKC